MNRTSFYLLFLFLGVMTTSSNRADEKAPEEIKLTEAEKKLNDDKRLLEEKLIIAKDQEKKALDISRNFFKLLKNKKINEATKLLSVPFIYDEVLIFDSNEISGLFTSATFMEAENLFFEIPVFSIHKKQKSCTENNILVNMQEKNADEDTPNILILIDRDSLKITGMFLNLNENAHAANEKIKAKLESKQNKTKASASQVEE